MKKGEKERSIINAGLAGAQTETVQRYGAAVKEHIVAYTGEDQLELPSSITLRFISLSGKAL